MATEDEKRGRLLFHINNVSNDYLTPKINGEVHRAFIRRAQMNETCIFASQLALIDSFILRRYMVPITSYQFSYSDF